MQLSASGEKASGVAGKFMIARSLRDVSVRQHAAEVASVVVEFQLTELRAKERTHDGPWIYGDQEPAILRRFTTKPFYATLSCDGAIQTVVLDQSELPAVTDLKKGMVSWLQIVLPPQVRLAGTASNSSRSWPTSRWEADEVDVHGYCRPVYSLHRCDPFDLVPPAAGVDGGALPAAATQQSPCSSEPGAVLHITKDVDDSRYYATAHPGADTLEANIWGKPSVLSSSFLKVDAVSGALLSARIHGSGGMRNAPIEDSDAAAQLQPPDQQSVDPGAFAFKIPQKAMYGHAVVQVVLLSTHNQPDMPAAEDEDPSEPDDEDGDDDSYSVHLKAAEATLHGTRRLADGLASYSLVKDTLIQSVHRKGAGDGGNFMAAHARHSPHAASASDDPLRPRRFSIAASRVEQNTFANEAASSGRSIQELTPPSAQSDADEVESRPLHALFDAIACFPAVYQDDSLPVRDVRQAGEDPTACFFNLRTLLVESGPSMLRAVQMLLAIDPCGVDGSDAAIDGSMYPACNDPAWRATVLSDRMVAMLISALPTVTPAVVSQGILSHMIRQPHMYRYLTVLEHALQATFQLHAPSPQLVAALLHAAQHIDPDGLLHRSEPKALALLAAAAAAGKARRMYGRFHPEYAADSTDGAVLGLLQTEYSRVSAVLEARRYQRRLAGEIVAATWQLLPYERKMAYRAQAREVDVKEASSAWASPSLTDDDRAAWDAQAAALLREHTMDRAEGDLEAMEIARADVLAHMHAVHAVDVGIIPIHNASAPRSEEDSDASADETPAVRRLTLSSVEMDALLSSQSLEGNPLNITVLRGHWLRELRRYSPPPEEGAISIDASLQHAATYHAEVVMRAIGNLGHTDALPMLLNHTWSADHELRLAAVSALSGMPGDQDIIHHMSLGSRRQLAGVASSWSSSTAFTSVVDAHSGRQLLSDNGADATSIRLPVSGGPAVLAHYATSAASFVSRDHASWLVDDGSHAIADPFKEGRLLQHGFSTSRYDTQSLLLGLLWDHHDHRTKHAAVAALATVQPLKQSTLDSLMDYFESHLGDTVARPEASASTAEGADGEGGEAAASAEDDDDDYSALSCREACTAADEAVCAGAPGPRCASMCEVHCGHREELALAIARLLHVRVRRELSAARAAVSDDAVTGHVKHVPALALAARRLQRHRHDTRRRLAGSVDAGSNPSETIINSLTFKPSVVEEAAQDGARRLAAPRSLSHATNDGHPHPRHLSRARRLGIFTLVDINLGKVIKIEKSFGDQQNFGAGFMIISRHLFGLRAGLFDGYIKADSFNAGGVWAALWGSSFWLADAKAMLLIGMQYTNKFARDLSDVIGFAAGNAVNLIQFVANKLAERIREGRMKIMPTIQRIDSMATSYLKLARDLIGVVESVVDGLGLTSIAKVLQNYANQLLNKAPAVKSFLDQANKWRVLVSDVVGRIAQSPIVGTVTRLVANATDALQRVDDAAASIENGANKLLDGMQQLETSAGSAIMAPISKYAGMIREVLMTVNSIATGGADVIADEIEQRVSAAVDKQLGVMAQLGLGFASNSTPAAAEAALSNAFRGALAAITTAITPIQRAAKQLDTALNSSALSVAGPVFLISLLNLGQSVTIPTAVSLEGINGSSPRMLADASPELQTAIAGVKTAVRALQDAVCRGGPGLSDIVAGTSDAFAVTPLSGGAAASNGGRRLGSVKSKLNLATLQAVLGNVSLAMGKVQGFASMFISGPLSPTGLSTMVRSKVQPLLKSLSASVQRLIGPTIDKAKSTLALVGGYVDQALAVFTNAQSTARRMADSLVNGLQSLIASAVSKAATSNSTLALVARLFNSTSAIVDAVIGKLEPLVRSVILKMQDTIQEVVDRVVAWISKNMGGILASAKNATDRFIAYMAKRQVVIKVVRAGIQGFGQLASSVQDFPFGGPIGRAADKLQKWVGDLDKAVTIVTSMATSVSRLMTVDGAVGLVLDTLQRVVQGASGMIPGVSFRRLASVGSAGNASARHLEASLPAPSTVDHLFYVDVATDPATGQHSYSFDPQAAAPKLAEYQSAAFSGHPAIRGRGLQASGDDDISTTARRVIASLFSSLGDVVLSAAKAGLSAAIDAGLGPARDILGRLETSVKSFIEDKLAAVVDALTSALDPVRSLLVDVKAKLVQVGGFVDTAEGFVNGQAGDMAMDRMDQLLSLAQNAASSVLPLSEARDLLLTINSTAGTVQDYAAAASDPAVLLSKIASAADLDGLPAAIARVQGAVAVINQVIGNAQSSAASALPAGANATNATTSNGTSTAVAAPSGLAVVKALVTNLTAVTTVFKALDPGPIISSWLTQLISGILPISDIDRLLSTVTQLGGLVDLSRGAADRLKSLASTATPLLNSLGVTVPSSDTVSVGSGNTAGTSMADTLVSTANSVFSGFSAIQSVISKVNGVLQSGPSSSKSSAGIIDVTQLMSVVRGTKAFQDAAASLQSARFTLQKGQALLSSLSSLKLRNITAAFGLANIGDTLAGLQSMVLNASMQAAGQVVTIASSVEAASQTAVSMAQSIATQVAAVGARANITAVTLSASTVNDVASAVSSLGTAYLSLERLDGLLSPLWDVQSIADTVLSTAAASVLSGVSTSISAAQSAAGTLDSLRSSVLAKASDLYAALASIPAIASALPAGLMDRAGPALSTACSAIDALQTALLAVSTSVGDSVSSFQDVLDQATTSLTALKSIPDAIQRAKTVIVNIVATLNATVVAAAKGLPLSTFSTTTAAAGGDSSLSTSSITQLGQLGISVARRVAALRSILYVPTRSNDTGVPLSLSRGAGSTNGTGPAWPLAPLLRGLNSSTMLLSSSSSIFSLLGLDDVRKSGSLLADVSSPRVLILDLYKLVLRLLTGAGSSAAPSGAWDVVSLLGDVDTLSRLYESWQQLKSSGLTNFTLLQSKVATIASSLSSLVGIPEAVMPVLSTAASVASDVSSATATVAGSATSLLSVLRDPSLPSRVIDSLVNKIAPAVSAVLTSTRTLAAMVQNASITRATGLQWTASVRTAIAALKSSQNDTAVVTAPVSAVFARLRSAVSGTAGSIAASLSSAINSISSTIQDLLAGVTPVLIPLRNLLVGISSASSLPAWVKALIPDLATPIAGIDSVVAGVNQLQRFGMQAQTLLTTVVADVGGGADSDVAFLVTGAVGSIDDVLASLQGPLELAVAEVEKMLIVIDSSLVNQVNVSSNTTVLQRLSSATTSLQSIMAASSANGPLMQKGIAIAQKLSGIATVFQGAWSSLGLELPPASALISLASGSGNTGWLPSLPGNITGAIDASSLIPVIASRVLAAIGIEVDISTLQNAATIASQAARAMSALKSMRNASAVQYSLGAVVSSSRVLANAASEISMARQASARLFSTIGSTVDSLGLSVSATISDVSSVVSSLVAQLSTSVNAAIDAATTAFASMVSAVSQATLPSPSRGVLSSLLKTVVVRVGNATTALTAGRAVASNLLKRIGTSMRALAGIDVFGPAFEAIASAGSQLDAVVAPILNGVSTLLTAINALPGVSSSVPLIKSAIAAAGSGQQLVAALSPAAASVAGLGQSVLSRANASITAALQLEGRLSLLQDGLAAVLDPANAILAKLQNATWSPSPAATPSSAPAAPYADIFQPLSSRVDWLNSTLLSMAGSMSVDRRLELSSALQSLRSVQGALSQVTSLAVSMGITSITTDSGTASSSASSLSSSLADGLGSTFSLVPLALDLIKKAGLPIDIDPKWVAAAGSALKQGPVIVNALKQLRNATSVSASLRSLSPIVSVIPSLKSTLLDVQQRYSALVSSYAVAVGASVSDANATFTALVAAVKAAPAVIVGKLSPLLSQAVSAASSLAAQLTARASALASQASNLAADVKASITSAASSLASSVQNISSLFAAPLRGLLLMKTSLGSAASGGVSKVLAVVLGLVQSLDNGAESAASALSSLYAAAQGIPMVGQKLASPLSLAKSAVGRVIALLPSLRSFASDGAEIGAGVLTSLSSLLQPLVDVSSRLPALSSIADKIVAYFNNSNSSAPSSPLNWTSVLVTVTSAQAYLSSASLPLLDADSSSVALQSAGRYLQILSSASNLYTATMGKLSSVRSSGGSSGSSSISLDGGSISSTPAVSTTIIAPSSVTDAASLVDTCLGVLSSLIQVLADAGLPIDVTAWQSALGKLQGAVSAANIAGVLQKLSGVASTARSVYKVIITMGSADVLRTVSAVIQAVTGGDPASSAAINTTAIVQTIGSISPATVMSAVSTLINGQIAPLVAEVAGWVTAVRTDVTARIAGTANASSAALSLVASSASSVSARIVNLRASMANVTLSAGTPSPFNLTALLSTVPSPAGLVAAMQASVGAVQSLAAAAPGKIRDAAAAIMQLASTPELAGVFGDVQGLSSMMMSAADTIQPAAAALTDAMASLATAATAAPDAIDAAWSALRSLDGTLAMLVSTADSVAQQYTSMSLFSNGNATLSSDQVTAMNGLLTKLLASATSLSPVYARFGANAGDVSALLGNAIGKLTSGSAAIARISSGLASQSGGAQSSLDPGAFAVVGMQSRLAGASQAASTLSDVLMRLPNVLSSVGLGPSYGTLIASAGSGLKAVSELYKTLQNVDINAVISDVTAAVTALKALPNVVGSLLGVRDTIATLLQTGLTAVNATVTSASATTNELLASASAWIDDAVASSTDAIWEAASQAVLGASSAAQQAAAQLGLGSLPSPAAAGPVLQQLLNASSALTSLQLPLLQVAMPLKQLSGIIAGKAQALSTQLSSAISSASRIFSALSVNVPSSMATAVSIYGSLASVPALAPYFPDPSALQAVIDMVSVPLLSVSSQLRAARGMLDAIALTSSLQLISDVADALPAVISQVLDRVQSLIATYSAIASTALTSSTPNSTSTLSSARLNALDMVQASAAASSILAQSASQLTAAVDTASSLLRTAASITSLVTSLDLDSPTLPTLSYVTSALNSSTLISDAAGQLLSTVSVNGSAWSEGVSAAKRLAGVVLKFKSMMTDPNLRMSALMDVGSALTGWNATATAITGAVYQLKSAFSSSSNTTNGTSTSALGRTLSIVKAAVGAMRSMYASVGGITKAASALTNSDVLLQRLIDAVGGDLVRDDAQKVLGLLRIVASRIGSMGGTSAPASTDSSAPNVLVPAAQTGNPFGSVGVFAGVLEPLRNVQSVVSSCTVLTVVWEGAASVGSVIKDAAGLVDTSVLRSVFDAAGSMFSMLSPISDLASIIGSAAIFDDALDAAKSVGQAVSSVGKVMNVVGSAGQLVASVNQAGQAYLAIGQAATQSVMSLLPDPNMIRTFTSTISRTITPLSGVLSTVSTLYAALPPPGEQPFDVSSVLANMTRGDLASVMRAVRGLGTVNVADVGSSLRYAASNILADGQSSITASFNQLAGYASGLRSAAGARADAGMALGRDVLSASPSDVLSAMGLEGFAMVATEDGLASVLDGLSGAVDDALSLLQGVMSDTQQLAAAAANATDGVDPVAALQSVMQAVSSGSISVDVVTGRKRALLALNVTLTSAVSTISDALSSAMSFVDRIQPAVTNGSIATTLNAVAAFASGPGAAAGDALASAHSLVEAACRSAPLRILMSAGISTAGDACSAIVGAIDSVSAIVAAVQGAVVDTSTAAAALVGDTLLTAADAARSFISQLRALAAGVAGTIESAVAFYADVAEAAAISAATSASDQVAALMGHFNVSAFLARRRNDASDGNSSQAGGPSLVTRVFTALSSLSNVSATLLSLPMRDVLLSVSSAATGMGSLSLRAQQVVASLSTTAGGLPVIRSILGAASSAVDAITDAVSPLLGGLDVLGLVDDAQSAASVLQDVMAMATAIKSIAFSSGNSSNSSAASLPGLSIWTGIRTFIPQLPALLSKLESKAPSLKSVLQYAGALIAQVRSTAASNSTMASIIAAALSPSAVTSMLAAAPSISSVIANLSQAFIQANAAFASIASVTAAASGMLPSDAEYESIAAMLPSPANVSALLTYLATASSTLGKTYAAAKPSFAAFGSMASAWGADAAASANDAITSITAHISALAAVLADDGAGSILAVADVASSTLKALAPVGFLKPVLGAADVVYAIADRIKGLSGGMAALQSVVTSVNGTGFGLIADAASALASLDSLVASLSALAASASDVLAQVQSWQSTYEGNVTGLLQGLASSNLLSSIPGIQASIVKVLALDVRPVQSILTQPMQLVSSNQAACVLLRAMDAIQNVAAASGFSLALPTAAAAASTTSSGGSAQLVSVSRLPGSSLLTLARSFSNRTAVIQAIPQLLSMVGIDASPVLNALEQAASVQRLVAVASDLLGALSPGGNSSSGAGTNFNITMMLAGLQAVLGMLNADSIMNDLRSTAVKAQQVVAYLQSQTPGTSTMNASSLASYLPASWAFPQDPSSGIVTRLQDTVDTWAPLLSQTASLISESSDYIGQVQAGWAGSADTASALAARLSDTIASMAVSTGSSGTNNQAPSLDALWDVISVGSTLSRMQDALASLVSVRDVIAALDTRAATLLGQATAAYAELRKWSWLPDDVIVLAGRARDVLQQATTAVQSITNAGTSLAAAGLEGLANGVADAQASDAAAGLDVLIVKLQALLSAATALPTQLSTLRQFMADQADALSSGGSSGSGSTTAVDAMRVVAAVKNYLSPLIASSAASTSDGAPVADGSFTQLRSDALRGVGKIVSLVKAATSVASLVQSLPTNATDIFALVSSSISNLPSLLTRGQGLPGPIQRAIASAQRLQAFASSMVKGASSVNSSSLLSSAGSTLNRLAASSPLVTNALQTALSLGSMVSGNSSSNSSGIKDLLAPSRILSVLQTVDGAINSLGGIADSITSIGNLGGLVQAVIDGVGIDINVTDITTGSPSSLVSLPTDDDIQSIGDMWLNLTTVLSGGANGAESALPAVLAPLGRVLGNAASFVSRLDLASPVISIARTVRSMVLSWLSSAQDAVSAVAAIDLTPMAAPIYTLQRAWSGLGLVHRFAQLMSALASAKAGIEGVVASIKNLPTAAIQAQLLKGVSELKSALPSVKAAMSSLTSSLLPSASPSNIGNITGSNMTTLAKAKAMLASVSSVSSQLAGALNPARLDVLIGLIDSLQAKVADAVTAASKQVTSALTSAISQLRSLVGPSLESSLATSALPDAVVNVIRASLSPLSSWVGGLDSAARGISAVAGTVAGAVSSPAALDPIKSIVKGLSRFTGITNVLGAVGRAADSASRLTDSASSLYQGLSSIGGDARVQELKSELQLLASAVPTIKTSLTNLSATISRTLGGGASKLSVATLKKLQPAVDAVIAAIGGGVSTALRTIEDVQTLASSLMSSIGSGVKSVIADASSLGDSIGAIAGSMTSSAALVTSTGSVEPDPGAGSFGIGDQIMAALGDLGPANTAIATVKSVMSSVSSAGDIISSLQSDVASLSRTFGSVADVGAALADSFKTLAAPGDIADAAAEVIMSALASIGIPQSVIDSIPLGWSQALAYLQTVMSANAQIGKARALLELLAPPSSSSPGVQQGMCGSSSVSVSSASASPSALPASQQAGQIADTLQCLAALSGVSSLTIPSTGIISVATTSGSSIRVDVSRCASLQPLSSMGITLSSLLPSINLDGITGLSAFANPALLSVRVQSALAAMSSASPSAGTASSALCTDAGSGACGTAAAALSRTASLLSRSLGALMALEPAAGKALSEVLGPRVVGLAVKVRDMALPPLKFFARMVGGWMQSALGFLVTPTSGRRAGLIDISSALSFVNTVENVASNIADTVTSITGTVRSIATPIINRVVSITRSFRGYTGTVMSGLQGVNTFINLLMDALPPVQTFLRGLNVVEMFKVSKSAPVWLWWRLLSLRFTATQHTLDVHYVLSCTSLFRLLAGLGAGAVEQNLCVSQGVSRFHSRPTRTVRHLREGPAGGHLSYLHQRQGRGDAGAEHRQGCGAVGGRPGCLVHLRADDG